VDIKRSKQFAAAVALVAILGGISVAQAGQASYDPATHTAPSKPRDSFLDFTLGRVNASDANYGQCLSEDRRILLEETVRNAYFWSNIVALGVLSWLFLVIVYQHKVQTRRDWTTAEIVTELEQSLTRSRAQVAEASKKNGELTDALVALKESASRSPSVAPESAVRARSSTEKPRTTSQSVSPPALRQDSTEPTNGSNRGSATGKNQVGQMRLFTTEADFVMKLNSLEQQLAQSREDNKQLRQRISDRDRRPGTEQDRTRQLKGA
jgi:hypothetical protein